METASDGSLWYVAAGAGAVGVTYGRIAHNGAVRQRYDPPFQSDPSIAITPAGDVWISNGSALLAANENRSAYLSRIDANLNVVERQVVPDDPGPALIKETHVGELVATNRNGLLFPFGWSAVQPDSSTRLFGEMTSARQIRVSPAATPGDSGRLFSGRGRTAWLVSLVPPAFDPMFARLNDDGTVARRYSALHRIRILDAAQGADGRFWVTQARRNSIGQVTLTP